MARSGVKRCGEPEHKLGLLVDEGVVDGQVGRVELHRVFDEEDDLQILEDVDVVLAVDAVLHRLDHRMEQTDVPRPDERPRPDVLVVRVFRLPPDPLVDVQPAQLVHTLVEEGEFAAVRGKEQERDGWRDLVCLREELKHILAANAQKRDDKLKPAFAKHHQPFLRSTHPNNHKRFC